MAIRTRRLDAVLRNIADSQLEAVRFGRKTLRIKVDFVYVSDMRCSTSGEAGGAAAAQTGEAHREGG